MNSNQMTMYETEDGKIRIDVLFDKENVWLTQKLMAMLFECSVDNVSLHLKNSFSERELDEKSVIEEFSITAPDGKKYKTKHYSLEAIIAVGYRVNTARGTQFRAWATDRLKSYILKGFAIDKDRFIKGSKFDARYFDELLEEIREIRASERMVYQKITDIYATSVDYSPRSVETERFFATVQNKLHFAITGKTAAEIITSRADKSEPHMGLTTWRKAPKGKILPSDIRIAKNYLSKEELKQLNHIVDMYLDHAEFQASRGRLMHMRDWAARLDAFLKFNEQDILQGKGKVSHDVAVALAEKHYESFRITQDRRFESDFDREVKKLRVLEKKKSLSGKKKDKSQ
ncbi:MAG: cell filamentation protein Fic [Omnitrophica bacterium GWA2_52_8]|nr:MAG: cell filamentation protein Fic [Omnitrophica bacterium GWA2_52_8]